MTVGSAAEIPCDPYRACKMGGSVSTLILAGAHCLVGTAGAVTVTTDHPDITVTPNASTGRYDIVFPKCLSVRPRATIVYASSTTTRVYGLVAPSATGGTWSIQFEQADGTDAWPASTDQFDIELVLGTEPA